MLLKVQLIVGALSLVLIFLTFEFIRKGRLREEYSILWLSTGLAIFFFTLWPEFFLSQFFSRVTGIFYLSAIVLIAFFFLLLIVFHFSVVISKLTLQNKELAQRFALLEMEYQATKKQASSPTIEESPMS